MLAAKKKGGKKETARRPNYGETIDDVWARRKPWFKECSTHDFLILKSESDWEKVDLEVFRFVTSLQQFATPNVLGANRFVKGPLLLSSLLKEKSFSVKEADCRGFDGWFFWFLFCFELFLKKPGRRSVLINI